jgi:mannose-6-phosphate isomerase-like protein (cupin superfamily)
MDHLDSPNIDSLDRFAFAPRRVEKPWGWELIWAHSDRYCGKQLFVREGHALSLQFHKQKDETIYVHEGRVEFEIGEAGSTLPAKEVVGPGTAFRLRPGTIHRMRALEDSLMLEVSTPELDDVVRLEDEYGRIDG